MKGAHQCFQRAALALGAVLFCILQFLTPFQQEMHHSSSELLLQTISCIELGKKAVRPENLAKLCKSLQVSSDYILYGKRDVKQMDGLINKLSALGKQEYEFVNELIAHFDRLCSKE